MKIGRRDFLKGVRDLIGLGVADKILGEVPQVEPEVTGEWVDPDNVAMTGELPMLDESYRGLHMTCAPPFSAGGSYYGQILRGQSLEWDWLPYWVSIMAQGTIEVDDEGRRIVTEIRGAGYV